MNRLETDKNHMKGKYDMEMIRCVWGKTIEFLPIKMLTGPNIKAVEKRRGAGIEIADPELGVKLTKAQLKALAVNFPEIDPDFELPPEPLPLTDAELGDLLAEPPLIDGVPEEHTTVVFSSYLNEKIRLVNRPYQDGMPVAHETETPAPIKRGGRKPKTTA